MMKIRSSGSNVTVHKVSSHAIERGIAQAASLTFGNDQADHYALEGAKLHELGWQAQGLVDFVDSRATLILKRLMAVTQLFLTRAQRQDQEPMARVQSNLDTKIVELGHEPITHRAGGQICTQCGVRWQKQHRSTLVSLGPCLRHSPWTALPPSYMAPWKCPPCTTIMFNGRCIHPTHRLVFYRGVLYCNHCGYYSSGARVSLLSEKCRLKCRKSQKPILKRMRAGIPPLASSNWPLPDECQTPSGLLPFLSEEQATAMYPQATATGSRR